MNSDHKNENILNQVATGFWGTDSYATSFALTAGAALIGGGALYYLLNSLNAKTPKANTIINHANQTREVEGRTDGARISTMLPSDKLFSCYYEDGRTLYELFLKAKKISDDGDYLGWKPTPTTPYKWLKYSEVEVMAKEIGSAFLDLGLEPCKEHFVGIYARNRPEWVITETACNTYSLVTVPLYDTLGQEAISFILIQTQLKIVVCDDSEKAMQLMYAKSNLEYLVVIDNKISQEARDKANELNLKILTLEELREIGRNKLKISIPPAANDLATICYTSGTTGTPKGALITHGNIVAIASSMLVYVKTSGLMLQGEQERYLSYLPLAHMFERVSQATVLSLGGRIGFYQGDIKKLVDDMKEVRPTIFCTVPRLLNRIYAKITGNLETAPAYKKALFKWAFAQKEKEVLKGITRNNSIYDFAFKQIRESLGGSVRFIITGSAPISPQVLHFLRVVSGCHVLEGYGATETGGASGVQIPGETTVGNIGPPFLCSMYKLADVPEMNLEAKRDNKGEVLVYGANIFKGYYKDEEKTKAALDNDDWYHTGDIGSFDKNGTLKIVDRVKNIFKLAQGEYIAPEKIENIYVRSKYVAQVFIYGNSYKSSLVAVIVPEETVLFEWARENNAELNMKTLCSSKQVCDLILRDITQIGKKGGLKGFEQTKEIYLHDDLFSVENGLLTPTMKSKRNEIQKYFQKQIDAMCEKLD